MNADTTALLSSVGLSERRDNEKIDVLKTFLKAGSTYRDVNAVDVNAMSTTFKVDEWSSFEDIEIARKQSLSAIGKLDKSDAKLEPKIAADLLAHTSFTLELIDRICRATSLPVVDKNIVDTELLVQIRELTSERLFLHDRLDKLAAEVINLTANIHLVNQEKNRSERLSDRLNEEISLLKESLLPQNPELESLDAAIPLVRTQSSVSSLLTEAPNKDLIDKISILEKQISESEVAKAKLESLINEKLAIPISDDSFVHEIQLSMEEIRKQFNQRITSLVGEVCMKTAPSSHSNIVFHCLE